MKDGSTIAAIATPTGVGGIGIIRISGYSSLGIIEKIFSRSPAAKWESHRAYYGHIVSRGEVIDEVLVLTMLAPRSYTTEDVVEIHCHGGTQVLRRVLKLVLDNGAQLAQPGEFTKRAFLNGRIDLAQSEAVIDIINAKTEAASKAALKLLGGHFSALVKEMAGAILNMLAHIEASIDYPEHELEAMNLDMIATQSANICKKISHMLANAQNGQLLREGIQTVIIGRPNVGKSSLLNALLQEDRAIVTPIAGTTRDILQETVQIDGVPLTIIDTAGIRKTQDAIEKIGVEKSMACLSNADLVLLVLDKTQGLTPQDEELLKLTHDKKAIVLLNKNDLAPAAKLAIDAPFVLEVSATKKDGLNDLGALIKKLFLSGDIAPNDAPAMLTIRHIQALAAAENSLQTSLAAIQNGLPEDIVSVDLQEAYRHLGEITGEFANEDIIDKIFSQFCLGK